MTVIYDPDQSAAILRAAESILEGNNGWSFISAERWLHEGLQAAGFVVLRSTDFHGRPAWKGYTRASQVALRKEATVHPWAAESTYKTAPARSEGPDYEAAILARQERQMMDW